MEYLKSVSFSLGVFLTSWSIFYLGGLLGNQVNATLILALLLGFVIGMLGVKHD